MPTGTLKSCIGCGKGCDRADLQDGRCKECAGPVSAEYERYRASDPVRKAYNSSAWRKFRAHMLVCNPICQRIIRNPLTFENEQCHDPAVEVHHLISPRADMALMKTPSNVVCLCKHCHGKTQGEPGGKRDPALYIATLEGFGATGGVRTVN